MKRWIVRIALLLLVGVAINILATHASIRWAPVEFLDRTGHQRLSVDAEDVMCRGCADHVPGAMLCSITVQFQPEDSATSSLSKQSRVQRKSTQLEYVRLQRRIEDLAQRMSDERASMRFVIDARGWPFPTIQHEWHASVEGEENSSFEVLQSIARPSLFDGELVRWINQRVAGHEIESRVLWPGALYNTLIFAACAFVVASSMMIGRRTWKRPLVIAVACAMTGCVITFIVSWGCAYSGSPYTSGTVRTDDGARLRLYTLLNASNSVYLDWDAYLLRRPGFRQVNTYWSPQRIGRLGTELWQERAALEASIHRAIPGWAANSQLRQGELPAGIEWRIANGVGWPMAAMYWEQHNLRTSLKAPESVRVLKGLELDVHPLPKPTRTNAGAATKVHRALPLGIAPFGFAINSLLAAYACFIVLTYSMFALRGKRYLRRQRGACLQCGYDLRGAAHEQCPECGAQTEKRTGQTVARPR